MDITAVGIFRAERRRGGRAAQRTVEICRGPSVGLQLCILSAHARAEEITQGQEKNHLKGLMEQLPEITHSLSNNSLKSIGRSTQKHFATVVTKLALDDILLCSQYFQVTTVFPSNSTTSQNKAQEYLQESEDIQYQLPTR